MSEYLPLAAHINKLSNEQIIMLALTALIAENCTKTMTTQVLMELMAQKADTKMVFP